MYIIINKQRTIISTLTFQAKYSFGVYENQPYGTPVGAVIASDADSDIYAEISYQLWPDVEQFSINELTGEYKQNEISPNVPHLFIIYILYVYITYCTLLYVIYEVHQTICKLIAIFFTFHNMPNMLT